MYCRGDFRLNRPYKQVLQGWLVIQPSLQIDLQGRLVQIDLQGRLITPAASTNQFVEAAGVTNRPTNRFVGAAVVPVAPIIPICRGGSVQNRSYSTFSHKKNQIYNSNSTRTLFVSAYSIQHSRCRTPRDQRSKPRSRCRTSRDQRSEPRSRCRTPRDQRSEPLRLQAQEYYINYNYKSNSQEYIQPIIKYTIPYTLLSTS